MEISIMRILPRGRSLAEEQENDKNKHELALKNGIKEEDYIIINCRKSELEFIKNNILHSRLAEMFDLSKVDWLKCEEFTCTSRMKEAWKLWDGGMKSSIKIAKELDIGRRTSRKYLLKGSQLGLCTYDRIKALEETQFKKGYNIRSIICLTTGEIFKSREEATSKYHLRDRSVIRTGGKYKGKPGGRLPNGKSLYWMEYDEFVETYLNT